ncbi:hypothetical protein BDF21DRAFT_465021 [Thamnidium elegans]|nr:hypothetical protein BDF21DRAFT_465021 [Thamnidium elegans]
MLAKEVLRPQPKPRSPPQPDFESMDDIKPMPRVILKRPEPTITSTTTESQADISPIIKNDAAASNQWRDTTKWDDKTNHDKSSQPEINSYSSSSEVSPSAYRPRTRDHALDSIGIVKITPAVTKFDDIKSEAMVSWKEGVDLRLDNNSNAKKKPKEWLSQSVFFSDEPSSSSPSKNVSPDWLQNTERTYAEATHQKNSSNRKTPDWVLEEVVQRIPQNIPYEYNQGRWTPTAGAMTHQMQPMMMMPSPYMQVQPSIFPSSPRDTEYFRYFYIIVRDQHIVNSLTTFQKKMDKILQRYLAEFSPRTFAKFLEALVLLIEHEISFHQIETCRRIRESWQLFLFFVTKHLQVYTKTPEDLISLLRVCTLLQRYNPKVYKELPVLEMVRVYESIKGLCTTETSTECINNLRILKGMPDTSGISWRDIDERLPSVPSAEDIVKEVANKVDSLADYETKKEIRIVNKVHNPWPNVDLLQYTLVHFMMLREELLKPIQNTIDALFSGNASQSIEVPNDCAVFEHTMPKSTTMLVSSSETAIVFRLGPCLNHDDMMNSFEEGSFVIILPESKDAVSPSDHHHTMMNMAKGAMMGQAVRASSRTNYRLASVHIHKDDISRMDWSAKYTIITCHINALATLSVLSWLRKEYVDLKKERFSSVLTPRILAASNTLTNSQLSSWDEENIEQEISINQDCVPFYLLDTELNVSCLMVNNKGNYKAKPAENLWPRHSSQWENVASAKRPPLYAISPSQLSAIKFAMSHRIAVISGASGTGKTFIAAKLAQLMSQALHAGQFHQPLLIIAKTQSSLDTVLSQITPSIPDVIRFGGNPWDQALVEKQATRQAAPSASDSNYRQHQQLERQLVKNQGKLNALFLARFQASEHDPVVMCTAIEPDYLKHMQKGYMDQYNHSYTPNLVSLWNKWAGEDPKTRNFSKAQEDRKEFGYAQWLLEINYLKRAGRGLMPILDKNYMQTRFTWVANNPVSISPIVNSFNWPFETSTRTGKELRTKLANVWERIPTDRVWKATHQEKTQIVESLANILVTYIDYEIHAVLQDQIKTAKAFDDNLIQKLTYLCRFNRVIGLTADFAAAHRDWVSSLWPRAIIVDEASEILESTLASSILGTRTEHLVLLGNNDNLSKPHLSNSDMAGNPRNLDVSLFERWKGSGSEMVLLEEQWRMCSEVANIIDQFNSIKDETSSLLITAPLASCNENMVDGSKPQEEIMYGITQRALYLDYQAPEQSKQNQVYSTICKLDITDAEVDEARFVAYFAVYLSQQRHPKTFITILTVCLAQKYLIRAILKEEVPKRTSFTSNVDKITVDTVEQNGGRQDSFTIVSTATPAHSFSTRDNVSFALTRARYGLFVIGKPEKDDVHDRWKDFAKYMKTRGLRDTHIRLSCFEHGDTFTVEKWQDFNQMPNGGCSAPCLALMNDGHVCPEVCHYLSHDEVKCLEKCNRIRPSKCQHECKKRCYECSKNGKCPPCEEMNKITLSCGHTMTDVCHSLQHPDDLQCQVLINVELDCGHEATMECFKSKDLKHLVCQSITRTELPCGHIMDVQCGKGSICTEICDQSYECGHPCREVCGIEHSHARKGCEASCPKQLICGHGCANGCANPDRHTERCVERCNYMCSHGYKCTRECWKDCTKCVSVCPYSCKHFKCTKKCSEICDRPPCNKYCSIKLDCGHECSGLCGEPCPPCSTCHGELKCSISLRALSEFEEGEKAYVLPECGCVFSVESLDMYFLNQSKNGEHTAVKLWGCPTCQKSIFRAYRYNKFIKTEINLVNTIKLRIEKERQKLTYNEKTEIINAMNNETKQGPHNLVGGRWFVCKNQHPYFVGDCGGATEISKCPECDAPIGGTQHKVVESNRFYGEFDGSDNPAWPGQPVNPKN